MTKFFIKPKPPYNFELIISLFARFSTQCVDLYQQGTYKRLLEINKKLYLIVEYMMCRGMGRYDTLPAKDIALRSGVTQYLGKKERVSEQKVRKVLKKFGQHKGKAAFYLIYAYAFQKYPQERLL